MNGKRSDCCRNIGHFRKMYQHKKVNAIKVVEDSRNENPSVEEEAYSVRLYSVDDHVKGR